MIVATRDGRARSLERRSYPFSGGTPRLLRRGRGIELTALGLTASYDRIYRSQPWVFIVVNKLARACARIPAKAYRDEPLEDVYLSPGDVPAHPLPILFSRPFPRGSRFKLIEATVGDLAIHGQALWWKYRQGAGQAPVELWPIPWGAVQVKSAADAPIGYYEATVHGVRKKFLPDDVVHFQWWDPSGEGVSPLEPLRETLALEAAGRRYAVSSFANAVRPAGALVTPKTLTPRQKVDLRAELLADAGPDQAFRMALLDGGLDWKPFSHTAQEAQTIEHRKLNREEVCAVYDFDPTVLHILDHATFSNVTENNKSLYRETLGPWFAMMAETISSQLLWGEPDFAGTFIEFDLDKVLEADLPARASAYVQLERTISLNERRKLEGLRALGDPGDEGNPANGVYLPLNTAVLLPSGDVLVPGGNGAADSVAGSLAALIDERIAAAALAGGGPTDDGATVHGQ